METRKTIQFIPYSSMPLRLTVGDIVRCEEFSRGFEYTSGRLLVAWPKEEQYHRQYLVDSGKGKFADDPSRATANFLVCTIDLQQSDGPDDVAPGEHRLAREVSAIRLSESCEILSEEIHFSLDEPMSMCRPEEAAIEIRGYATLPIVWMDSDSENDG